jgi:hypothetical protein
VTLLGSLLMVLVFIFVTVQMSLHLLATSQASGVVLEGASRVARGNATCAEVTAWIDATLASWPDMHPACRTSGDAVRVSVRGSSPAPAIRGFGIVIDRATLSRSASMQIETGP